MRILHLTSVNQLTQGQRKQLFYEYCSAATISSNDVWDVLAFHNGDIEHSFEFNFPPFFKGLFLRNLFTWIYLIKNSGAYDLVLVRHMTFDPFVLLLGWFVENRFSVHHSKESDELKLIRKGWKGKAASWLESLVSRYNFLQIKGGVGVTNDICVYQKKLSGRCLEFFLYPNGIDVNCVQPLEDLRVDGVINIAFVCGTFSPWHGLDRLIEYLKSLEADDFSYPVNIHLVGSISQDLYSEINELKLTNCELHLYGFLDAGRYREILSVCDIAFGSLAMDRQGLKEGATLKVREYLAMGLPVFSGHVDTAIPKNFPFYVNSSLSIAKIGDFAIKMKKFSRSRIREESIQYISKKELMVQLISRIAKSEVSILK